MSIVYQDSGLMVFANETPKIGAIFVPTLGNAPKFCHFIENMTEELEESINKQIFNDFQFVTHEEMESLNGMHLLRSGKATPHMHGYLVDHKTFTFLKSTNYLKKIFLLVLIYVLQTLY
jgi:ribosome biogenesis protein ENP2